MPHVSVNGAVEVGTIVNEQVSIISQNMNYVLNSICVTTLNTCFAHFIMEDKYSTLSY